MLTYILIFLIILLFVPIFMWVGIYLNKKNKRDKIEQINEDARREFKEKGFKPERYIYIENYSTIYVEEKQFIAINKTQGKIGLIDYDSGNVAIVDLKDFVDFEIYEDKVDSMVGSSYEWGKKRRLTTYEAKQVSKCKELRFIIYLNNDENDSIVYESIGGTFFNLGYDRQSSTYKECVKSMQRATGLLKGILKGNDLKEKSENIEKLGQFLK